MAGFFQDESKNSILLTADLGTEKKETCLHFTYYAFRNKPTENYLELTGTSKNTMKKSLLWALSSLKKDAIQQASITLNDHLDSVWFQSNFEKFFLIEIRHEAEACKVEIDCDFETSRWCHFEEDSEGAFAFKRAKASENKPFGPDFDSTFNSLLGHYLTTTYKVGKEISKNLAVLQLNFPTSLEPGLYQASFDLHRRNHATSDSLTVCLQLLDNPHKIKLLYEMDDLVLDVYKPKHWQSVQFIFQSEKKTRLLFLSRSMNMEEGNRIAIDNFRIRPYTDWTHGCKFDEDMCLFSSYSKKFQTFTLGTGRLYNQSSMDAGSFSKLNKWRQDSNGKSFLYLDFTNPIMLEDDLRFNALIGPEMHPGNKQLSISFDYSIIFSDQNRYGEFTFIVNLQGFGMFKNLMVTKQQTDTWTSAHLRYTPSRPCRLVFEILSTFTVNEGLFALRNLKVTFDAVTSNQQANKIDDLSCELQVDWCGWTIDSLTKWNFQKQPSSSFPKLIRQGNHFRRTSCFKMILNFNFFSTKTPKITIMRG